MVAFEGCVRSASRGVCDPDRAETLFSEVQALQPDDFWAEVGQRSVRAFREPNAENAKSLLRVAEHPEVDGYLRETIALQVSGRFQLPNDLRDQAYKVTLAFESSSTPLAMRTINYANFLMEDARRFADARKVLSEFRSKQSSVSPAIGFGIAKAYLLEARQISATPGAENQSLVQSAMQEVSDQQAFRSYLEQRNYLRALEPLLPALALNDVDQAGRSPLCIAALKAKEHEVAALLASGAEVDALSCEGTTALAGVIRHFDSPSRSKVQIAKLLMRAGADPNPVIFLDSGARAKQACSADSGLPHCENLLRPVLQAAWETTSS